MTLGLPPLWITGVYFKTLQAIQKGAARSNQFVDLEATNYDGKRLILYWLKNHVESGGA